MCDRHQGIDSLKGFDIIAHLNPVVGLVQLIETGILNGKNHNIPLLPESFSETGIVEIGTVCFGEQICTFIGHLNFSGLKSHEIFNRYIFITNAEKSILTTILRFRHKSLTDKFNKNM